MYRYTTAGAPASSCKNAVANNVGGDLVWIKPGGAPAAFLAGCELKLGGGGWTLLVTQTDPIANFQGSVNPFVDNGDVGAPSATEPYARNWANVFLPVAGDEFMIVKDGGEYVTFTVSTWCPGAAWHSLTATACGGSTAYGGPAHPVGGLYKSKSVGPQLETA
jgi:hypothetical protein